MYGKVKGVYVTVIIRACSAVPACGYLTSDNLLMMPSCSPGLTPDV